MPVLALVGVLSIGCRGPIEGKVVDAPDVKALLRPSGDIAQETLIEKSGGRLLYVAVMKERPSPDYLQRYLNDLEQRGVSIDARGTSPHAAAPRITGYLVRAVQEARLEPYTIRFKLALDSEDSPEQSGSPGAYDYAFPVEVAGRELRVRVGDGLLQAWQEAVVVPDKSVVLPPFAMPLPPTAAVVSVREERSQVLVGGKFSPSAAPTGFVVDVVARKGPQEMFAFYKEALGGRGTVLSGDPGALTVRFVADAPAWAPAGLEYMTLAAEAFLFGTTEGISVYDARHARFRSAEARPGVYQPKSLTNLPTDAFRYRIGFKLRKDGSGR